MMRMTINVMPTTQLNIPTQKPRSPLVVVLFFENRVTKKEKGGKESYSRNAKTHEPEHYERETDRNIADHEKVQSFERRNSNDN